MTIDELIEAAKNRPVNTEDIEAFRKRLQEIEEEFGDMDGRVSNEWLSREYGISDETIRLAKEVADMPPPAQDEKSIEEWATRLAEDLAKFTD